MAKLAAGLVIALIAMGVVVVLGAKWLSTAAVGGPGILVDPADYCNTYCGNQGYAQGNSGSCPTPMGASGGGITLGSCCCSQQVNQGVGPSKAQIAQCYRNDDADPWLQCSGFVDGTYASCMSACNSANCWGFFKLSGCKDKSLDSTTTAGYCWSDNPPYWQGIPGGTAGCSNLCSGCFGNA